MSATPNSNSVDFVEFTAPSAFGPPFDDADADIVLRSSDRVEFLVYKVILSKASPFFKTMFSLPQPAMDTPQDSRPIIDLTEDSRALAIVLSAIYPCSTVMAESHPLNDLVAALAMTEKYEMAAAVSGRLLQDFTNAVTLCDTPFEAFYAAFSHRLREAARVAARASLKYPLTLDELGEKLPDLNGHALHTLWKFHRACSSAAAALVIKDRELAWIELGERCWWFYSSTCHCEKKDKYYLGPEKRPWWGPADWSSYFDSARKALQKRPCSEAVTHREIFDSSISRTKCRECLASIRGLPEFSRYLGEEVERIVSNVPLELPF
ncbi:hypothetical protein BC827DRAFT_572321 [Russula dissimulans]|nr:hypothetical protein BC827DRAFT_572321 [Russula dissimulans]